MLTLAMALHFISAILMLIHMWRYTLQCAHTSVIERAVTDGCRYSDSGEGMPILSVLSEGEHSHMSILHLLYRVYTSYVHSIL